jgi:restriction system protein
LKLRMAENSLFAILLRSSAWVSFAIAAALALAAAALLPEGYKIVGALSASPFAVIGALAALRQWRQPSAEEVARLREDVMRMAWPAFAQRLEEVFRRDGYEVRRLDGRDGMDFELERRGRRMAVSARRWKSARTGAEALRALQAARAAGDIADALYIGLGELSENARPYAAQHRIAIWGGFELAQAFKGPLPALPRPT